MEHSPTSATGTGWEPTPRHAIPKGGVGGAEEGSGLLGGRPPRHGLSQSTLALEQGSLSLSDQHVGSVAGLSALLYKALRRLPHRMGSESYLRGQHRAAEEMGANGFGEIRRHRGHTFVPLPPTTSAAIPRSGSSHHSRGIGLWRDPRSTRRSALAPPMSGLGVACSQRATGGPCPTRRRLPVQSAESTSSSSLS